MYLDSGLSNGDSVSYYLVARNLETLSVRTGIVVATPAATPLAAPSWTTILASDKKATLAWTPVGSVDGPVSYSVFRRLSTETEMNLVRIVADTNFTDTPLVNRTRYVYAVIATNPSASSPMSGLATVEPYAAPGVVGSLQAHAFGARIRLGYQVDLEAGDTVAIYRSLTSGGPYSPIGVSFDTAFIDTSVTRNVTYYYVARHFRLGSSSELSNEVSGINLLQIPATPGHFQAVAGDGYVRTSWDSVPDIIGYIVKRVQTIGGSSDEWVLNPSQRTFVDSSVVNGNTYYYTIEAGNEAGRSLPGDPIAATPLPAVPSAPTGLAAVGGTKSVSVSWNGSVGATSYTAYRAKDTGVFVAWRTLSGTSIDDTGLLDNTSYSYYVRAANLGGSSPASATVSARTKPAIPAAPSGVVATAGDKTIRVSWSAVPGAASYTVKTSTVSGGPYTVAQTGIVSTSHDLTGIVNGTAYYVVVSASNTTGEGANSAQVSATPVVPAGLKVLYKLGDASATDNTIRPLLQIANTGTSSVNLSDVTLRYWYTNEQAKGQAMWCDWANVGSANVVGTYKALATSAPGADGYMEVSFNAAAGAIAPNGNSGEIQIRITRNDWSNHNESGDWSYDATKTAYADWDHITLYKGGVLVWGKEPGISAPPSVPFGVRGFAGNRVDTLSWNAAANATSYNVYRNLAGGAMVKIASTARLSFIDTGLVNGTLYVYRVAGVNGSLESAKSDSVLLVPRGVAPVKVTGLVARATNHLVSLNWTASATTTSYKVVRTSATDTIRNFVTTGTSYLDSSALNDVAYGYRVIASNAWGSAPASDSVRATPRAQVGGLKVQYKVGVADASTNAIKPFLQVVNTGTTAIPLSEVTVRYWFTNDGGQTSTYWCDWAQIGSANLMGTIRTVSPAKPTADRYLEISFKTTAGNLAAGASTGEIQNRFSKSDWTRFTQGNDASFDATKSAYVDYNKVTVYRNGVLVWGVEP